MPKSPYPALASPTLVPVRAFLGDLLTLDVDAIVNPSNPTLDGGGGLDALIHRAAGPDLLAACRLLGGCPVGQAKATPGFNLPAAWVIHTVGPKWRGGTHSEPSLLAATYANCLKVATQLGVRRLAFPAISTGVYRYPKAEAAKIAVRAVGQLPPGQFDEILLVANDQATYRLYQRLLANKPAVRCTWTGVCANLMNRSMAFRSSGEARGIEG